MTLGPPPGADRSTDLRSMRAAWFRGFESPYVERVIWLVRVRQRSSSRGRGRWWRSDIRGDVACAVVVAPAGGAVDHERRMPEVPSRQFAGLAATRPPLCEAPQRVDRRRETGGPWASGFFRGLNLASRRPRMPPRPYQSRDLGHPPTPQSQCLEGPRQRAQRGPQDQFAHVACEGIGDEAGNPVDVRDGFVFA